MSFQNGNRRSTCEIFLKAENFLLPIRKENELFFKFRHRRRWKTKIEGICYGIFPRYASFLSHYSAVLSSSFIPVISIHPGVNQWALLPPITRLGYWDTFPVWDTYPLQKTISFRCILFGIHVSCLHLDIQIKKGKNCVKRGS